MWMWTLMLLQYPARASSTELSTISYADAAAVPGEGLVHGVVDDLVYEVV